MLAAIGFAPLNGPDGWNTMLAGMLGVAAMGVRIASARLLIDKIPRSTIMTGNVSQITIDAIVIFLKQAKQEEIETARLRIKKTLPTVIAFVIGAALGSAGYLGFKFYALCIPTIIMFCLGVREHWHSRHVYSTS